ncbi:hotdog fold thioesterase [Lacihabitans sp. CCS-44]|uniref:hotdog fold thioesterase n=1 Tax=Lacihabitans sp. CCS-44 TaxID=2487331 RepID=UPI0020CD29DF|nr:hotdog fold thioesterase [Lacihabitans sp. CCS-44]MCP9753732.1 hotdog fold thioesterase [Lacihabitans sp. CCS-44]
MFNKNFDLESLNAFGKNTLPGHIGIEFTELGDDFIIARMPVDSRTHQPFGILHGGASVVLAETIGSLASMLCLQNPEQQKAVGLEINANHLRAVKTGWVYGKVTAIHVGAKTHVWDIKITNEENKPICICRLTTMII